MSEGSVQTLWLIRGAARDRIELVVDDRRVTCRGTESVAEKDSTQAELEGKSEAWVRRETEVMSSK